MTTFLKYLNPTSYFLKESAGGVQYWVDVEKLEEKERQLIDYFDSSGSTYSKLDGAWQALNRGIICHESSKSLDLSQLGSLSLEEEYRFVRRFFSPVWVVYCYFLRLVLLKNPFLETRAFLKALKIPRLDLFAKYKRYQSFGSFESTLVKSRPLVSVIIPTLNRYEYLYDVMRDLEQQDYRNFEVIVVDQSEQYDEGFYDQFDLKLNLIQQKEKALWLARNEAVRRSQGDYMLLYDDDSRVDPDWIRLHMKCLDYFDVDISSGVSLSVIGAVVPPDYSYFRWSGQLDTGNVLVRRHVFRKVGLFDRQFEKQRMGDCEFGLRCHINGLRNISNPLAKRTHLKVGTGGLRQMGSWDAFRPRSLLSPRPIPSVLYLCRQYFGTQAAILLLLKFVPPSVVPYRFKRVKYLLLIGYLLAIPLLPLITIQVLISWVRATKMLKSGPKISNIDE